MIIKYLKKKQFIIILSIHFNTKLLIIKKLLKFIKFKILQSKKIIILLKYY